MLFWVSVICAEMFLFELVMSVMYFSTFTFHVYERVHFHSLLHYVPNFAAANSSLIKASNRQFRPDLSRHGLVEVRRTGRAAVHHITAMVQDVPVPQARGERTFFYFCMHV
jgi:hypothetical protein